MTSCKDSLIQTLRNVTEEIVVGERWDNSLVGRVKTQLRHVLLRNNKSDAVVNVELVPSGLAVHIQFPSSRDTPRVLMFTVAFL